MYFKNSNNKIIEAKLIEESNCDFLSDIISLVEILGHFF